MCLINKKKHFFSVDFAAIPCVIKNEHNSYSSSIKEMVTCIQQVSIHKCAVHALALSLLLHSKGVWLVRSLEFVRRLNCNMFVSYANEFLKLLYCLLVCSSFFFVCLVSSLSSLLSLPSKCSLVSLPSSFFFHFVPSLQHANTTHTRKKHQKQQKTTYTDSFAYDKTFVRRIKRALNSVDAPTQRLH